MSDDHSSTLLDDKIEELVRLLRSHDVDSRPIKEFLDKNKGTEYISEFQSVLDIKELLEMGLIR